jgi:shikimate kinase
MEPEKNNVVLIGMPGAGKSTVGVLLAKRLEYDFLDTDIVIQAREGRGLHQIIREEGTERFRKLEAAYVRETAVSRCVVATGGSVVYDEGAMNHLRAGGRAVFLDLSLTALADRLGDIDARGVTRTPGQTLADLFAEREPLYRRYADIVVRCDGKNPEMVVRAALAELENFPGSVPIL